MIFPPKELSVNPLALCIAHSDDLCTNILGQVFPNIPEQEKTTDVYSLSNIAITQINKIIEDHFPGYVFSVCDETIGIASFCEFYHSPASCLPLLDMKERKSVQYLIKVICEFSRRCDFYNDYEDKWNDKMKRPMALDSLDEDILDFADWLLFYHHHDSFGSWISLYDNMQSVFALRGFSFEFNKEEAEEWGHEADGDYCWEIFFPIGNFFSEEKIKEAKQWIDMCHSYSILLSDMEEYLWNISLKIKNQLSLDL